MSDSADSAVRDVVLGRGSTVWRRLSREPALAGQEAIAIGHAELADFRFTAADRVWVLAYSRVAAENSAMLARLRAAGVREVVYVSSSAAIVAGHTQCYAYPRVKRQAETEALALAGAKVLTIGLMYTRVDELPGGDSIATSYEELADFIRSPHWPDEGGRRKHLFRLVQRPFSSRVEGALHAAYGRAIRWLPAHPCWLRPVDLVLRVLGMRWYGYTYLSNRLWISTTS